MAVNAVHIATAVLAAALLLLSLALIFAGRAARPRLGRTGQVGGAFLVLAIGLLAQAIAPLIGGSAGATLGFTVVGLVAVLAGVLLIARLWRQNRDHNAPMR